MSQKKVEQYKEYKKNKEQILKREKRIRKVEYGVIILICCVFVFRKNSKREIKKRNKKTALMIQCSFLFPPTRLKAQHSGLTAKVQQCDHLYTVI